jgi:hypothetical protein
MEGIVAGQLAEHDRRMRSRRAVEALSHWPAAAEINSSFEPKRLMSVWTVIPARFAMSSSET